MPTNGLQRAIHAAARAMHLDDDTRRDRMFAVVGKRSTSEMTPAEMCKVLDDFNQDTRKKPNLSGEQRKAKALFISAYLLGGFESNTDKALNSFIERQTGISALQFCEGPNLLKVTEGLKAICAREGVEWNAGCDREAVLHGLCKKIWPEADEAERMNLVAQQYGIERHWRALTPRHKDSILKRLGATVRAGKRQR